MNWLRRGFVNITSIVADHVHQTTRQGSVCENIFFTHRGLSGPAILQVSSYCEVGKPVAINLLLDRSTIELLLAHRQPGKELKTVLAQHLSARFTQVWCARWAESRPMHRCSNDVILRIARRLERWEVCPAATEGYAKAEVTLVGVGTIGMASAAALKSALGSAMTARAGPPA